MSILTLHTSAPAPDVWAAIGEPPLAGEPADKLRFAVQVASTAPSPANTQPWRFLLADDQVELYSDPARGLAIRDPEGQQRVLAGGAALGLLRVALRALGLDEHTELTPDDHPDLLARVRLTGSVAPTPEQTWLLQAAPKRRSHRPPMADKPVRERLLQRLQDMSRETGAELVLLTRPAQRAALATRVEAALAALDLDPDAQAERATHPELGLEPFELTRGGPARGSEIAAESPALALLTTPDDDPRAWLRAGQALARVLLRARVDHLFASYLPHPLVRAGDRWAVAEEAAVLGDLPQTPGYAQLALRLGYGGDLPATPRRPLADLLLTAPP
jgi:nitroreductase